MKIGCWTAVAGRELMLRACLMQMRLQTVTPDTYVILVNGDRAEQFDLRVIEDLIQPWIHGIYRNEPMTTRAASIAAVDELLGRDADVFFKIDSDDLYRAEYLQTVIDYIDREGLRNREEGFCVNLRNQLWLNADGRGGATIRDAPFSRGLGLTGNEQREGVAVGAPPTFCFSREIACLLTEANQLGDLKSERSDDRFFRRTLHRNGITIECPKDLGRVFGYVRHGTNTCKIAQWNKKATPSDTVQPNAIEAYHVAGLCDGIEFADCWNVTPSRHEALRRSVAEFYQRFHRYPDQILVTSAWGFQSLSVDDWKRMSGGKVNPLVSRFGDFGGFQLRYSGCLDTPRFFLVEDLEDAELLAEDEAASLVDDFTDWVRIASESRDLGDLQIRAFHTSKTKCALDVPILEKLVRSKEGSPPQVHFLNGHIGPQRTGIENASLLRRNVFESGLRTPATILTTKFDCEFGLTCAELRETGRIGPQTRFRNLYEDTLGYDWENALVLAVTFPGNLSKKFQIRPVGNTNDYRVFGPKRESLAYYRHEQKHDYLQYANFLDGEIHQGQLWRRDTFAPDGSLVRIQFIDRESRETRNEIYLRSDGRVGILHEYRDTGDARTLHRIV